MGPVAIYISFIVSVLIIIVYSFMFVPSGKSSHLSVESLLGQDLSLHETHCCVRRDVRNLISRYVWDDSK
jgi:hypothetical protein